MSCRNFVSDSSLIPSRIQNTNGDSKTTVFKHIGLAIFPEPSAIDATTIANRLKGQLEQYVLFTATGDSSQSFESLMKLYRKQASQLCQTGGGLDENDGPSQSHDEELSYCIPAEGLNTETPATAVNLWCMYFL